MLGQVPMVHNASHKELLRNRNRTVARTLYRQLKNEGFSHEHIIELSTNLLDLVTDDLRSKEAA